MKTLTIHPSFSGLLNRIEDHSVEVDSLHSPNVIFHFGCTKEGIEKTVRGFGGRSHEATWANLKPILEEAELDGRVRWHTNDTPYSGEWLKAHITSRNGVMEDMEDIGGLGDFYKWNNLPYLREWCKNVTNLRIWFRWS